MREAVTLRKFLSSRFPDAPIFAGASSRVAAVARFRDSKVLRNDLPEIVCVRAWIEDALLQEGQPVGAAEATMRHGVFAFLLGDLALYTLRGTCALVENPAVFINLERLALPVGLVIYGRGRASNRLLDWLATMTTPDFVLLHLPDYDPVGLSEFERLSIRLGKRVSLHLPDNLGNSSHVIPNAPCSTNSTAARFWPACVGPAPRRFNRS